MHFGENGIRIRFSLIKCLHNCVQRHRNKFQDIQAIVADLWGIVFSEIRLMTGTENGHPPKEGVLDDVYSICQFLAWLCEHTPCRLDV
jgi:hypothetical protein